MNSGMRSPALVAAMTFAFLVGGRLEAQVSTSPVGLARKAPAAARTARDSASRTPVSPPALTPAAVAAAPRPASAVKPAVGVSTRDRGGLARATKAAAAQTPAKTPAIWKTAPTKRP